jgi:two-component system NarL family sensor kinase
MQAPATRVAVAVAAGVTVALLAAGGLWLQLANGGAEAPNGKDYTWAALIACASFGLPGALLVLRGTAVPVGAVSLLIGMSFGLSAAATGWALYALKTDPGALPGAGAAVWLSWWCWPPGYCAISTLLPLVLPDGRLSSARWRLAAVSSLAAIVAISASFALGPYSLDDMPRGFADQSNSLDLGSLSEVLGAAGVVLLVASAVLALASVVIRYRGAADDRREQLKWVGVGAAFTLLLLVAARLAGGAGDLVFAVAMVPLPAGVTIAVLRHRMWDVNVVLRRSLVSMTLTVAVVVGYVAVVWAVGKLVERTVAGAVAAAVVAVALQPLYRRLQADVNQVVYGDRDDPNATLRRLGERLVGAGKGDESLSVVAQTVARALRLPYVAVTVDGGPGGTHGTPTGGLLRIALRYRGERVGEFVAAPREPRTGFSRADRRALETIGRQIAVAAHAAALAQELRRSREQLVLGREDERRRLRRDLHDQLGPTLAALALELETARDGARTDPAQVETTLARAAQRAREGVADVRRLVYDLRPPTLDDLGLPGALREQAERLSTDGLHVSLRAPQEFGPLAAAVEAAAFRIASEALANAVRHSGAAVCVVELTRDERALRLRIRDNGEGIGPEVTPGIGLSSMRERAEELGGDVEIAAVDGGGTEVRATIPLAVHP